MDDKLYPKSTINAFMNERLFFKDDKLKKYFERNEARDLGKFRSRVDPKESFEKYMYAFITDAIRPIILETTAELTAYMKPMGDLVISGGEAFNTHVPYEDRIITSDIDAKFVPRIPVDSRFFGKLQAIKLILWDKLGELAKRLDTRIMKRVMSMRDAHPKVFKFLGIGFKRTGPFVTRRYTLIKKKRMGTNKQPSKGDVFIDVELFALDLNIRYFSPESAKIEDVTMGGILDVPFMRPDEFGYEVAASPTIGNIASKEFLIHDIYLMHKLKLRPEKKEKDRKRLVKLARLFGVSIQGSASFEDTYKRVRTKLPHRRTHSTRHKTSVPMTKAARIDPMKYKRYTTRPSEERISKQFVHGLKAVIPNTNVPGYQRTNGNKRLDLNTFKWVNVNTNAYVRNEFNLRPEKAVPLPNNVNIPRTLYGYNPKRNEWVPKKILNGAATIPFVGLKK